MIELLRRVAATDPDRPAVVAADGPWSYGRLAGEAEALAGGLRDAGVQRFAIVSNDIPEVVALLAAADLIGADACVYEPIAGPADVARQVAAFQHDVVVTDRDDLSDVVGSAVRPADLRGEPLTGVAPPASRPLLVLTTGTTGAPRGVRHDWSRLLARSGDARDGAGQAWLLAYGPQQFAGLQVFIHVLGSGATLVAPPVRRPQAVVDTIHDHGVDHISATPTFWRFLLVELRADSRPLPSLRQVTLGGEAAPPALLDQLAAAFPDARISHVYAGSEFGSTGSVRDGRDGLPADLLERSDGEVALKIVDGELWVRSSAAMLGYHGEDDRAADEWWRTGDMVEVVDDRIVFRGRASEIINVGGVKVHPLPVEERVSGVPGVRAARVHGRPNALVGAVVAVDVVPEADVEDDDLKDRVREACRDLPRPWQPKSVRIVAAIETKGHKVVRSSADNGAD